MNSIMFNSLLDAIVNSEVEVLGEFWQFKDASTGKTLVSLVPCLNYRKNFVAVIGSKEGKNNELHSVSVIVNGELGDMNPEKRVQLAGAIGKVLDSLDYIVHHFSVNGLHAQNTGKGHVAFFINNAEIMTFDSSISPVGLDVARNSLSQYSVAVEYRGVEYVVSSKLFERTAEDYCKSFALSLVPHVHGLK